MTSNPSPLPGDEPVSDADLRGLLSPQRSARTPADPRSDPTEEEWQLLDFLRSQHEIEFNRLSPEEQAQQDHRTQRLREALNNVGFPIHDARALHTALVIGVTLHQMQMWEALASTCPGALHAFGVHTMPVHTDFGLTIRELLKDAGVRAPIQPADDEHAPTSHPGEHVTPTWKEINDE